MPLDEEGAKWSCEPCIRGHRSSKCQHFDRLMMKVPKAGRPLAKCPHPKGSCSCQKTYAFMVRIPKGSGCLCRPLYKVPANENDSSQPNSASMSSVSSPSSGKIQKSGRRQSNIQATPDSIARALEAMPEDLIIESGASDYLENLASHHTEKGSFNADPAYQPVCAPQNSMRPEKKTSCCAAKTQPSQSIEPALQSSSSCCGGKSPGPHPVTHGASHINYHSQNVPQPRPWNNISHVAFPPQQMHSWQNALAPCQKSAMESYGMPITQTQTPTQSYYMNEYTTSVATTPHSNPMNGLGITPPNMTPHSLDQSQNSAYASVNLPSEASHDCNCGDDCQCLGCASHPFNNTTRQHVQEMGVIMTMDGDDSTPDAMANGFQTASLPSNSVSAKGFFMPQTPSGDHGFQHNSFESYSDPNSAMQNGYSSPLTTAHPFNQQLMHPSEYYTIEYPVGIPNPCSDVTGSCQCGNDCSCVGCLTHSGHNGVALEPETEASSASTTENVPSSGDPSTSTHSSYNSRIPVLENVPMPHLSPRAFQTSMI